jgi:HlyD family secretion protein
MKMSRILIGILAIIIIVVIGYWAYQNFLAPEEPLPAPQTNTGDVFNSPAVVSAEGEVVPARQASLSYTQAGRLVEVLVREGDQVSAGDALMRLDTTSLENAVARAESALLVAKVNLTATETELERVRAATHFEDSLNRRDVWTTDLPPEIESPAWYFTQDEKLLAAQVEVEDAFVSLEIEQGNLEMVLDEASSADLLAAEARLAEAQAAFLVASEVLESAESSNETQIRDEAQSNYDAAESQLEAAQANYDQVLDSGDTQDVLEARSRLSVAQERYDTALDQYNNLLTGERALEIRAAEDAVLVGEALVTEAQVALESALIVLDEAELKAPYSGTISLVNVDVGEVVSPGVPVVLLADLSAWQVETTDLSENDVVLVEPGMTANVSLDALPSRTFAAEVLKVDFVGEVSRGAVVYTVTLGFESGDEPVRWGMTAFVDIPLP